MYADFGAKSPNPTSSRPAPKGRNTLAQGAALCFRSYAHSFFRASVRLPIRSFVVSFVCAFVLPRLRSFADSFIRGFVRMRIRSSAPPFVCRFVHSWFRSSAYSFVPQFVHPRIRSFPDSFIRGFVLPRIRSRLYFPDHATVRPNHALTPTRGLDKLRQGLSLRCPGLKPQKQAAHRLRQTAQRFKPPILLAPKPNQQQFDALLALLT